MRWRASTRCARTGCTAACSRCSMSVFDEQRSTPQRERFIELALAAPIAAWPRASAVAPSFLLACLLWHDVLARWTAAAQAGEHAVAGVAAGHRCGVRRAHRRHLGPRPARRRHARDLADAAALRAPHRQFAAQRWSSSRVFVPATTSCVCAPMPARSPASWPTGGRTSRSAMPTSARRCCNSRARPSAPAARPSRQQPVDAPAAAKKRRRRRRPVPGATAREVAPPPAPPP